MDAGCTVLNNNSIGNAIRETGEMIKHFHISQPQLGNFSVPEEYHREAALMLKKIDYTGWKYIEIKENNLSIHSIKTAISSVLNIYDNYLV